MKPIKFKEQNVVFAKDQSPYLPLPAYRDKEQGGRIFHCWGISLFERIKLLFTGKLWINVLNFGKPPQPIKPMVDSPFNNKKDLVKLFLRIKKSISRAGGGIAPLMAKTQEAR